MNNKLKILLVIGLLWLTPAICDAIYQPVGIIKSLLTQSFSTVFSDTFDISTPAGGDSPTKADDRMREIKAALRVREDVDHYWPLLDSDEETVGEEVASAFTGEHRKITFFKELDSDPTQVPTKAHLYMKGDNLYYQDDSNTTLQLTDGGDLKSSAGLTVDDNTVLSGTTTLVGVTTAGKILMSNFLDMGGNTVSNMAEGDSEKEAVRFGQWAPAPLTSQSYTVLPNDFMIKWGEATATANNPEVIFDTTIPFAAGPLVFTQILTTNPDDREIIGVNSISSTRFKADTPGGDLIPFNWMAIGRR